MCRAGNGTAPRGDDAGGAFWPNQRIFWPDRGYFGQITDILGKPWTFWPEPEYFGPIPSMLAKPIAPATPQPPNSALCTTGEAAAAPFAGGETEANRAAKRPDPEDAPLSSLSSCLCPVVKFSFHQPSSPEVTGRERSTSA